MSKDVRIPVRYETSFKDGVLDNKSRSWRVFLKHYALPLENWIDSWPSNPPRYREMMGEYCREVMNSERTRISVASFYSLGIDEKMKPAEELISEEQPAGYRESSFRDFLNLLSRNAIAEGNTFLDTLILS